MARTDPSSGYPYYSILCGDCKAYMAKKGSTELLFANRAKIWLLFVERRLKIRRCLLMI
jgi:hypothetical protein